eukprot:CCRYP_021203-RA/>CCRYP_021203-RA protein AED:0.38 eAED:0.37 QI:0/0/0/1/0/0/2/0/102
MQQIDFIQAYTQASLECEMYMELPTGIKTKHGNSKDYCIFYRDDIIFIVYINGGLFFSSVDAMLSLIIRKLRHSGLNIEDQGDPADYIGVNIKKTCDLPNEL